MKMATTSRKAIAWRESGTCAPQSWATPPPRSGGPDARVLSAPGRAPGHGGHRGGVGEARFAKKLDIVADLKKGENAAAAAGECGDAGLPDYDAAVAWYLKAKTGGDKSAAYDLARLYDASVAPGQDTSTAQSEIMFAATDSAFLANDADRRAEYVEYLLTKNPAYLQHSAAQQYGPALAEDALTADDSAETLLELRSVAQSGDARAAARIATFYAKGPSASLDQVRRWPGICWLRTSTPTTSWPRTGLAASSMQGCTTPSGRSP